MYNDIYNGSKVLVTGHTGFKGSWLCLWLQELGAEVMGYALSPITNPSHFTLLQSDYYSVIDDIRNAEHLNKKVTEFKPEIIFHLAAQPLVRYSYSHPAETYETNVMGTMNLLNACTKVDSVKSVVLVTTDKVYENIESPIPYKEHDRLGGYDPYSSSKACSEILVSSYRNSFYNIEDYGKSHQLLLATARGGNVVGGGDWSHDRLIPDIIRSLKEDSILQIRNPNSTRPWQHVLDCLAGYLSLGARLFEGEKDTSESFNFGPLSEEFISVKEILEIAKQQFPSIKYQLSREETPHEANQLQLDSSRAMSELCWNPVLNENDFIRMTFDWYQEYYENGLIITHQQLKEYLKIVERLKLYA